MSSNEWKSKIVRTNVKLLRLFYKIIPVKQQCYNRNNALNLGKLLFKLLLKSLFYHTLPTFFFYHEHSQAMEQTGHKFMPSLFLEVFKTWMVKALNSFACFVWHQSWSALNWRLEQRTSEAPPYALYTVFFVLFCFLTYLILFCGKFTRN